MHDDHPVKLMRNAHPAHALKKFTGFRVYFLVMCHTENVQSDSPRLAHRLYIVVTPLVLKSLFLAHGKLYRYKTSVD